MSKTMSAYLEYKEVDNESISKIPVGWIWSKLKFVASISGRIGYRGYTVQDIVEEKEGAITLSPSNILDSKINFSKKTYISWDKYYESPEIIVKKSDILFCKTGSTYGKSAIIEEIQEPMTINPQLVLIKPNNILPKYLSYLMESSFIKDQVELIVGGGTMPTISQEALLAMNVIIPSRNEQERITHFLDEKCVELDKLLRSKERLIQLLEEKRQAMITESVTKCLNPNVKMKDSGMEWVGEIPEEYNAIKLKFLVETKITDGPHETPILHDDGVPFISAEAIKFGMVDFNYKRGFISKEDHEHFSKKCSPKFGDIFMVKSGATTGKIGIVETKEEFSIWSPLALVRADKKKVLHKFLYFYMQSDIFQKQVQLGWNFGTQQNIGMGVIENLLIICPPLNIQEILLERFISETNRINSLKSKLLIQIQQLKEYRQSLIYEAVTGKIDVRDFEVVQ